MEIQRPKNKSKQTNHSLEKEENYTDNSIEKQMERLGQEVHKDTHVNVPLPLFLQACLSLNP